MASPHTSSLPSLAVPSMQAHSKFAASPAAPAAPNPSFGAPLSSSDDDLSDAPESPVGSKPPPPSPVSSSLSHVTPSPDSDSDLSDAPNSPVWPGGPGEAKTLSPQLYCTEMDCPVKQAVLRHHQGRYLHDGRSPRTNETIFGSSNPPPLVWKSWIKIQASNGSSTVEDDLNVFAFLRYHVDDPDTSLMGI